MAQGDGSEVFVNAEMVRAGLAYHYPASSERCPNQRSLILSEEMAQEAKVGVWGEADLVLPWEWRQQQQGG